MKFLLVLIFGVFLQCNAFASTISENITINGFGSVKAGSAKSNEPLYGYSDSFSVMEESVFALQFNAKLSDDLTAVAQLLGKSADDFDISGEWIFLKYQLSSETSITGGKILTPFFKYSDYMNVGYSYLWVRVPQSVYSLGFNTMDGVSVYHSSSFGDFDYNAQIVYGSHKSETKIGDEFADTSIDKIFGVTGDVMYDELTVRLAYLQGNISMGVKSLEDLTNPLRAFGLNQIADKLEIKDDSSKFFGVGFFYDHETFPVASEYTVVKSENNFISDLYSYYVSVGYKFSPQYTFYVLQERDSDRSKLYHNEIDSQNPMHNVVKGFLESQNNEKSTSSLGLKYDWRSNAVIKLQYTKEKDKLANSSADLLSLSVDFVF